MVKFKCKMCGYVLNVDENDTTVECEFCASKQTLPKMSAEKRLAYFNKGNDCRRLCDFDKALAYYKKLLEEDNTDPEVYWGILLCKYGVEYKESQQTFMMEPKIHRTQTTSIFDDKYYKLALKYASPEQKEIYEQDAKEISDKQNEVLEAAKTKAPVDVFICYKKLNEYSDTTVDSEIANLIYDELVMYDIKTFATGITLRDKKTDFEPYIYSALSSAKVMIVIGTKPDYLTDIWVKNEWNRYLKLIKNGEDKILIPVYKDINPEDYPKQFDDFESVNIDNLSNIVKVIKMVKEIFGKTEIVAKPAEEPADEMESIDNIVSEPAEDYSESSYEEPASYESESYETENYEQEPASDEPNYAQENSSEGYEKVDENVLNEIFAEPKKVETHSEPLEEKKATSQKPSYQDIMSNMFGSQAQTETKTAKTNIFDEKTAEKPGFSENTSTKPSFDEIINAKPSENETTRKPSFDEIVNAKPSVSETTRKPSFDEIVNAKPSASEVTPKETKVENKNQFSERKMQLIYDAAFDFIKLSRFVEAGKMFGKILDYKDSTKMYYRCINHDELVNKDNFYNKLVFEMNNISENETDVNKVQNLINRFTAIKDYRDVNQKIEELEQVKKKAQINYDNLLKETYTRLVSEIDDKNELKVEAKRLGYLIEAFNEIYNYKDVPKIINELKEKQKQAEEDYKEYLAEKKRKKRKKIKKISILTSIFAIILGTIITLSITLFIPLYKYNKAEKLYNQGNYEEARNIYDDLDEFKNSWQRYAAINCIIFLNDNEDEYIIFYDSSYYYDSQFINKLNDYYLDWMQKSGINIKVEYDTEGGYFSTSYGNDYHDYENGRLNLKHVSRDGYYFTYYTVSYEYVLDGDFTLILTAHWDTETYSIYYYGLEYGSSNTNPRSYTIDTPTITLSSPSRTGYNFIGWFTSETGGSEVTSIPQGSYGYKYLYARWTPIVYNLTYYDNGEQDYSNPSSYTIQTSTFSLVSPSAKTGYTFDGWYTAETGGSKVTSISQGSTGDKTFYARWSLITYSITYNNLNGVANNSNNPTSYNYESNTIILAEPNSRTGYNFGGWFTSSSGGSVVTSISQGSTGDKSLYARWTPIVYNLTYYDNGEQDYINPSSYTIQTSTFSLVSPSAKTGYTFDGWYTAQTGGNKVTSISQGSTGDKTFYARWSAISYSISYNLSGGTNNPNNPTSYTIASANITLADPTKTGYTFTGWTNSEITTPTKQLTIPTGSTGNKSFTANWQAITYTIKYTLNGGTNDSRNPDTYTASQTPITLYSPTKEGYDFDGWYTAEMGGSKVTSILSGSTGEKTFYARWIGILNFTLSEDENYYIVSGIGTVTNTDIVIPSNYNNKPVKNIANWAFYECNNLTSVVIPNSVTSIGNSAFWNCENLSSVIISSSVKTIGDEAFVGCKLTNILFEENSQLTSIGSSAFSNCSMTSITIPNSVISIGSFAFSDCTNLKSIIIPNSVTSIGGGAFKNCSSLSKAVISNNVLRIERRTFDYCSNLTSLTLGEKVKYIDIAFESCYRLVELYDLANYFAGRDVTSNLDFSGAGTYIKVIHKSLNEQTNIITSNGVVYYKDGINKIAIGPADINATSITIDSDCSEINQNAFRDCNNLTNISFSENSQLRILNYRAFYSCDGLTSITLPKSVSIIDDSAFSWCRNLTNINVSSNNANFKSIDGNLYTKDGKTLIQYAVGKTDTSFEIPSTVEKLGEYAFRGNSSLNYNIIDNGKYLGNSTNPYYILMNLVNNDITSYTINNKTKIIYSSVFSSCRKLTSITIPSSVKSIGSSAFFYCTNLQNITIPNSVTTIGDGAFNACSSLTNITLPSGLISIGDATFLHCSLNSINIPSNVTSIGKYAFSGCSLNSITIPSSVTSIGMNAFDCGSSLTSIEVSSDNNFYKSINGNLYSKDGKTLIQYAPGKTATSFIVPSSVTQILEEAFKYSTNLTNITLPSGLLSIGSYAFGYCSNLKSITIPKSVTHISTYAFSGCSSLTSVTFENNSKLSSISVGIFENCSSLTSITIQSNVTYIGSYAFYGCSSLTSITLKNTNGWTITNSTANYSLSSSELSNSATAATYLKSTYRDYYWFRV